MSFCRCCAGILDFGSSEKISIFEKNVDDRPFQDMILYCAGVEVLNEDRLPKFICKKCLEELEIAFKFKKKCKEAEEKLKKRFIIPMPIEIKIEDEDVDEDFVNNMEDSEDESPKIEDAKHELKEVSIVLQDISQKSPQKTNQDFQKKYLFHLNGDRKEPDASTCKSSSTAANQTIKLIELKNDGPTKKAIETTLKGGTGYLKKINLLTIGKLNLINLSKMVEIEKNKEEEEKNFCNVEYLDDTFIQEEETKEEGVLKSIKIKCCGCKCAFLTRNELMEHSEQKHKKSRVEIDPTENKNVVRQCIICYDIFEGLAYRRYGHLSDECFNRLEMISVPCCGCDGIFSSYQALLQHSVAHKGNHKENPKRPFECSICYKNFPSQRLLIEHRRITGLPSKLDKNEDATPMEEEEIEILEETIEASVPVNFNSTNDSDNDDIFGDIGNETVSKKKKATKRYNLDCCDCRLTYKNETELQQHALNVHKRDPPELSEEQKKKYIRECTICYRIFESSLYINQGHNRAEFVSRLKIINAPCCGCIVSFPTLKLLKEHGAIVHIGNKHENPSRPFECDVCFTRFKNERNVRDHVRLSIGGAKPSIEERMRRQEVVDNNESEDENEMGPQKKKKRIIGKYECCGCPLLFNTFELLEAHGREKHEKPAEQFEIENVTVHQCTICFETFLGASYLQKGHKQLSFQNRLKVINFPCCACNKSYSSYEELLEHAPEHNGNQVDEPNKPFACKICFKNFKSEKSVVFHRRMSTQLNRAKYELEVTNEVRCCGCKEVFETTEELRMHSRLSHESLRNLNGHPNRSHECDVCFRWYASAERLEHHQYLPYFAKKYICQLCGERYETATKLSLHVKQLHEIIEYVCNICSKVFTRKSSHTYHMKKHAQIFICDVCGKISRSKRGHEDHSSMHSTETPYACSICDKKFKRIDLVKIHMRVHSGFCPFSCRYCNRGFKHYSDCKRHEMKHTGKFPYSCKVCGKDFSRKKNWIDHEGIHGKFAVKGNDADDDGQEAKAEYKTDTDDGLDEEVEYA